MESCAEKRKIDDEETAFVAEKKQKNDPGDVKESIDTLKSDLNLQKTDDASNVSHTCEKETQEAQLDPLSYTRGEDFTSEIFKIQIHNLPKYFGFNVSIRLQSIATLYFSLIPLSHNNSRSNLLS